VATRDPAAASPLSDASVDPRETRGHLEKRPWISLPSARSGIEPGPKLVNRPKIEQAFDHQHFPSQGLGRSAAGSGS